MITIDDAKAMAKRLRSALADAQPNLTHSASLELVARQLGYEGWNTASSSLARTGPSASAAAGSHPSAEALARADPAGIGIDAAIPILRIFDEAKAREFYFDFLGFTLEFEHRFEADLPLYMGIERSGLTLHLSAHHGDAAPGSTALVPIVGIHALQAELTAKSYGFGRPGIERMPWGDMLEVGDPFGNRLRFCEYHDA